MSSIQTNFDVPDLGAVLNGYLLHDIASQLNLAELCCFLQFVDGGRQELLEHWVEHEPDAELVVNKRGVEVRMPTGEAVWIERGS